jgi:hypothetical protein
VFPVRYGLHLYILHRIDPRVGQRDFQSREIVKYGPEGLGSKNHCAGEGQLQFAGQPADRSVFK